MSPIRRLVCALVGFALLAASGWLFLHFLEVGGRYLVAVAAGMMGFAGFILLGSAVTGR